MEKSAEAEEAIKYLYGRVDLVTDRELKGDA